MIRSSHAGSRCGRDDIGVHWAAAVARDAGDVPVLLMTASGTEGSFNGACGFDALSSCSGVIRGEVFPDDPPAVFRLFKTFQGYP